MGSPHSRNRNRSSCRSPFLSLLLSSFFGDSVVRLRVKLSILSYQRAFNPCLIAPQGSLRFHLLLLSFLALHALMQDGDEPCDCATHQPQHSEGLDIQITTFRISSGTSPRGLSSLERGKKKDRDCSPPAECFVLAALRLCNAKQISNSNPTRARF
ncbi:hypothetical protein FN846DRAFT_968658 [Sphaerosporella brunnea]|uniref:Uncharacterized protein n=1 Tax=Sphaerosporella brunnea TaxID=1250544 RepID=A0A5J5EIY5_9PEZI|nr:hypothetical protein FN846DRAFT_968658 [Sphaerosporella brunnea]